MSEFVELAAEERERIYRDRLRGLESDLAVQLADQAAGDSSAEDRLAQTRERIEAVNKLIQETRSELPVETSNE